MHFPPDNVEASLFPYLRFAIGCAPGAGAANARLFGAATVNPGDDDEDDEEDDDDKGKGGGNIDPDDDEGYGDDDDDDLDEEPLQVRSKSSTGPCRMLRRTIAACRSACPSRAPRRITGPVRVRSRRRHTARSHWRSAIGN
jgi:hypothetical protein